MLQSLLVDGKVLVVLLFFSILLAIGDRLGYLALPKAGVQFLTTPIQYGLYKSSLGFTKQLEFITLSRRASQENKALTEQLAQVLSENANLRRKLSETQALVDQENAVNPQTFNLVNARPIGISRFLILDKGSDDGLKVNQAVIYKDNFIGEIKEISPKRAQVMLATDPDSRISAYVGNSEGKAKGVLVGQFGSEMLLDKVLHQEKANQGDLVYTEGTELEIPRGLIIGQVVEVLNRDNEIFKQAKVKTVFDVTNLDLVFVVTN